MSSFSETQGKHSSGGARRCKMVRRGVNLTMAVDKWDMGWGEMSLWWEGWVAESAHGICAHFPLLCCPTRKKLRNGKFEQGCK